MVSQKRRAAVRTLHEKIAAGEEAGAALWDAMIACQNETFFTSSGLPFSYTVRRKKNGEYSGELVVSRKGHSKTLTKSSVMLALEKVLAETEAGGEVPEFKGPKAIGQIFGISYIYSLFWQMGLIRVPEKVEKKLRGDTMIKNVIFDIGLVLIDWNPDLSGIFDAETAAAVEYALFGSELWAQLDLGIEGDEAIFEKMIALAPSYREQIRYIHDHLELLAGQRSYAKRWIGELKERGYHVYFLSNYSRILRESQPQVVDFISLMEGGVFSYEEQMAKPDARIYERICEKYQLVPQECLFIDDRQENVDAAIAYGMQSVRFDGYEQNYPAIMQMLEAQR